jgi:hypothetical protein
MPPHMVYWAAYLTANTELRHVAVSLPLAACLVDGKKYLMPEEPPPPQTSDKRTMRKRKKPRAPSLRSLVRLAMRCESATELGNKLRQRYERQKGTGRTRPDAGLDERLDALLGPVR